MNKKYLVLLVLLTLLTGLDRAVGLSVFLGWNASSSPEVTGYDIYYGTNSGSYANKMDVGDATSATIPDLTAGVTYYFTATAYDTNGVESIFSNETSYILAGILTMNPGVNAGDGPLIRFPVEPGHSYTVQATTDFQSWTAVWETGVVDSNTWLEFTDPDAASFSSRFYRLVLN